jgi:hypothetical protein
MEILLAIGVAMLAGLFLTRVTKRFNLPDVTSYMVAGLLVGPLVLGRLGIGGLGFKSFEFVEQMSLISDIALGFIAFSIGSEFRLQELRHIGRQATVIAIFQALTATVFVDVALIGLHFLLGESTLPLSTCLILGAIATATDNGIHFTRQPGNNCHTIAGTGGHMDGDSIPGPIKNGQNISQMPVGFSCAGIWIHDEQEFFQSNRLGYRLFCLLYHRKCGKQGRCEKKRKFTKR